MYIFSNYIPVQHQVCLDGRGIWSLDVQVQVDNHQAGRPSVSRPPEPKVPQMVSIQALNGKYTGYR